MFVAWSAWSAWLVAWSAWLLAWLAWLLAWLAWLLAWLVTNWLYTYLFLIDYLICKIILPRPQEYRKFQSTK
ncbi:MAG: hypothetical protein EOM50_02265 [Erysipelotrichia bacterium]|nr:hypothetical protein [Erysipelotrichia bacterium]